MKDLISRAKALTLTMFVTLLCLLPACQEESFTENSLELSKLSDQHATPSTLQQRTLAATATIGLITGYDLGGGAIKNGRHDGQPDRQRVLSNQYKGFLAVGFDYIIEWNINGSNFGTGGKIYFTKDAPQSGIVPKAMPEVTLEIVSWKSDVIKVRARSNSAAFESLKNVYIYVAPVGSNPNFSTPQNIAGFVYNRGVGQCTWYVSKTRVLNNKPYPPSPYYGISSLITINASYIPKIYDCLIYNGSHTGIITSSPILTETKKLNPTTKKEEVVKKSWSFTVSEMNCNWDEKLTQKSKSFAVELNNGQWKIATNIKTEASPSGAWSASQYYR